eukprot:Hpha_TRINITY_DN19003_c0_g1::TRINITY_DN19003_c0_g1_i1::g.138360::m.138360
MAAGGEDPRNEMAAAEEIEEALGTSAARPADWEREHAETLKKDNVWKGAVAVVVSVPEFEDDWQQPLPHAQEDSQLLTETFQVLGYDKVWDLSSASPRLHSRRGSRHFGYNSEEITCGALSWNQVRSTLRLAYAAAQPGSVVVLCVTTRGSTSSADRDAPPSGFCMQQSGEVVRLQGPTGVLSQLGDIAAEVDEGESTPTRSIVLLLDIVVERLPSVPLQLARPPPGVACLACTTPAAAPVFVPKMVDCILEVVEQDRRDGGWPLTVEMLFLCFDSSEAGWAQWVRRETLEDTRQRQAQVEEAHGVVDGGQRWRGPSSGWAPVFVCADDDRLDSACLVLLASSVRATGIRSLRKLLISVDHRVTPDGLSLQKAQELIYDSIDGFASIGLIAPEQCQPLQAVMTVRFTPTHLRAWEQFYASMGFLTAEMQHVELRKVERGRMKVFIKFGEASYNFHESEEQSDWLRLEARTVQGLVESYTPLYFGSAPAPGQDKDNNSSRGVEYCRVNAVCLRVEGVYSCTLQTLSRIATERRLGCASTVLRDRGPSHPRWTPGSVPSIMEVTQLQDEQRAARRRPSADPSQTVPRIPPPNAAGVRYLQNLVYTEKTRERVARAETMDLRRAFLSEQRGIVKADEDLMALCDFLQISPAVAEEATIRIQSVHRMAVVRMRFRKQLWQLHTQGLWPLFGRPGSPVVSPHLEEASQQSSPRADAPSHWMPPDGREQRRLVRKWLLAASRLMEWRVMGPVLQVKMNTGAVEVEGIPTEEDRAAWDAHYSRLRGETEEAGLAWDSSEYLTNLVRQKNPHWKGRVSVVLDGVGGRRGAAAIHARLRVVSEWAYRGDHVPASVHRHLQALAQELQAFLSTQRRGGAVEVYRVQKVKLTEASVGGARTVRGMARTAAEAVRDVLGMRDNKWRGNTYRGEMTPISLAPEAADLLWPAATTYARRGELQPAADADTVEVFDCCEQGAVIRAPLRGEFEARLLPNPLAEGTKVQEEELPPSAGLFDGDQWALVSWLHKEYEGYFNDPTAEEGSKKEISVVLDGDRGTFSGPGGLELGRVTCDRSSTGNAVRLRLRYFDSSKSQLALTGLDKGNSIVGCCHLIPSQGGGAPLPFSLSAKCTTTVRRGYVQRARYTEYAVLASRRVLGEVDLGEGGDVFRRLLEAPLLPGRAVCVMRREVLTGHAPAGGGRPSPLSMRAIESAGGLAAFLGVEFEGESTVVRRSKRADIPPGMHIVEVNGDMRNLPSASSRFGLSQRDVLVTLSRADAAHQQTLVFSVEARKWEAFLGCKPGLHAARLSFQVLLDFTELLDCAKRQGAKRPVPELPGVRKLEKTPYVYYSRYWADEGYYDEYESYPDFEEIERVRRLLPTVVAYAQRNHRYPVDIFRDSIGLACWSFANRECCGRRCWKCILACFWGLVLTVCLGTVAGTLFFVPRVLNNLVALTYNYNMTRLDIEQVNTWVLLHALILLLSILLAGGALGYLRSKFAVNLRSFLVYLCAKYSRLIDSDLVFEMRNEDVRKVVDLLFSTTPRLVIGAFLVMGCLIVIFQHHFSMGLFCLFYLILRAAFHGSYDGFVARHITAVHNIQEEEQLRWVVLQGPTGCAGHVACQQADDVQMRLCLYAREKREISIDNQLLHVFTLHFDWCLILLIPTFLVYHTASTAAEIENVTEPLAQKIPELSMVLLYYFMMMISWRHFLGTSTALVEDRSAIARVVTLLKYAGKNEDMLSASEINEIDDLLSLDRDDHTLAALLHVAPGGSEDGEDEVNGVRAEHVTHLGGRLTSNKVLLHIDWFDQIAQEHPLNCWLLFLCALAWLLFLVACLGFMSTSWRMDCGTISAKCFLLETGETASQLISMPQVGDVYGHCSLMQPVALSLQLCVYKLRRLLNDRGTRLLNRGDTFTAALETDTFQSGRMGWYKQFQWEASDPCPSEKTPWTHYRVIDTAKVLEEDPLELVFGDICFPQSASSLFQQSDEAAATPVPTWADVTVEEGDIAQLKSAEQGYAAGAKAVVFSISRGDVRIKMRENGAFITVTGPALERVAPSVLQVGDAVKTTIIDDEIRQGDVGIVEQFLNDNRGLQARIRWPNVPCPSKTNCGQRRLFLVNLIAVDASFLMPEWPLNGTAQASCYVNDVSFDGFDISPSTTQASIVECQSLCLGTSGCRMVIYNPGPKLCSLRYFFSPSKVTPGSRVGPPACSP